MTKTYRKGFAFVVLIVFCFVCIIARADDFAYIFSNDANFIQVDLTKGQVVKKGDLSKVGYNEIFRIIQDPSRRQILLLAARLPTRATRDEPTKTELIILNSQGKLARAIQDPIQPGDAVQGLVTPDGKKIILSLYSPDTKKERIAILDKTIFKHISTKNGFRLFENSVLSSNGMKAYAPLNDKDLLIHGLNLQNGETYQYRSENIGSPQYFSKGVLKVNNSVALIVENRTDPKIKRDPIFFIYDLDKENVLSTFRLNIRGDFFLLSEGKRILVNEGQPYVLPDGTIVGVRPERAGKLRIFETSAGDLLATIDVAENGKIAEISPNEKTAYYFSPKLLTLIDLEHFKVLKQIEVPFVDGMVAIVNADERKAAKPAPPAKKK